MVKKRRILSPLPLFDQQALPAFLAEHGYKPVHALTIWRYMAQHPDASFASIPSIPTSLRAALATAFVPLTTSMQRHVDASDGTIKLLLTLQDDHAIEAVILRHHGRTTLCVSSQVGCQMACTFCATGTLGMIANLTSGEILEQLVHASRFARIRNVVFMGMGEPLNNYDAVVAALRAMTTVFGLAPKHVTLSTVGVIPRMRQLTQDAPLVRLALSLHAPTQALRTQLVPTSTAYPLEQLMAAVDDHLASKDGRLVLVEYCLLAGVNDSIETAHELGKLLSDRAVHVNLIPYNPTDVRAEYQSPSHDAIRTFHAILRTTYHLKATIRENHGTDIDGACGQLALKHKTSESADIEDLGPRRRPRRGPQRTHGVPRDATSVRPSWLAHASAFLDAHHQAIGLACFGASVVMLGLGLVRRGRSHVT
ncbi:hypothetical protein PsorP6_009368 [Peronosclerospora sorghi]|uniref:Uncharacterized protein n=1 Tax=Peronosclerospora sorghi TaxID=230839 RepID=A0ACC0VYX3_9STRA|nr:hypothetical protein PsorP6_009368 [Peronosclerospora sorghi]